MLLLLQESELKNLAQFLIRKIDLLFISGSFQMAKSRFIRNAAQLGFGDAQKERGFGLRHKFGNIVAQVVHGLPLCVFALPGSWRAARWLPDPCASRSSLSPPCNCEVVRLRVWAVCSRGERGRSPARGGGPLSYRQDSGSADLNNSENPLIQNRVITRGWQGKNLSCQPAGLRKTESQEGLAGWLGSEIQFLKLSTAVSA